MRREEIMVCEVCDVEFDPEREPDTSVPVNTLRCPKCGHKHDEKDLVLGGWVGLPEHKADARSEQNDDVQPKPASAGRGEKAVYVMKSSMGMVKIGISKNPKSRRSSLITAHPGDLWLEASTYDCDAVEAERMLHEEYSEHRMNGEWFALPDELEAELVLQVRAGDIV